MCGLKAYPSFRGQGRLPKEAVFLQEPVKKGRVPGRGDSMGRSFEEGAASPQRDRPNRKLVFSFIVFSQAENSQGTLASLRPARVF